MPALPLPKDEPDRLNALGGNLSEAVSRMVQQESQFRTLVEKSSDIIHGFDAEGRILYANPAWSAALGYTAADVRDGLSVFQIAHPDFIGAGRDRLRRLMAGESVGCFESRFVTRDGGLIDVEGNVSCHIENGRPIAAYGIYRDITVRKALEEEWRRARCDAEHTSLAKSQFLANISHEIRTPLNGIIGMSSMLMLSGLNEDQLRFARTIDGSSRVLLTLVNQILDFSKLDSAAASLEQVCFELPPLIKEVATLMSARAQEKGLSLRWFIADDVPACLCGDPERLRQVLINLLGNAVKFTETGEVRLDVRVEPGPEQSPEEGVMLRFTIIDTGIGLQPDACERIFDAFAQADPSTTRKHGGIGLGLATSRQIVRLMGGDIHVHSVPGHGATFWFTARFALECAGTGVVPASAQAPTVRPPARPLRVLIAEDNTINQVVLCEHLSKLGHESIAVHNGVETLEALEASSWDAVFLDCQMPVMDGYETVAAIRRAEAADGGRRLWVVAVTASALEGEREACLRAGMDDFLSKPFQVQQLAAAIARIPPPETDDGISKRAVDRSLLAGLSKSRAVDGENLLDRMVNLFIDSGPQLLDQMDQALRQDDYAAAIRAIHKMAGGCSYFGAEDLYALCVDFERTGRLGNHGTLRTLAPRLRQEYARVELALQRDRSALSPLP